MSSQINDLIDIKDIVYGLEAWMWDNHRDDLTNAEVNAWLRAQNFPNHLVIESWQFNTNPTANGFAFRSTESNKILVGAAGTNLAHSEQRNQDIAQFPSLLLGGGLTEDYLSDLCDWVGTLKNVSGITGHSLSGSSAVIVGARHNIPQYVFNPAPLWFSGDPNGPKTMRAHDRTGGRIIDHRANINARRIQDILDKSSVTPMIFISEEDWLFLLSHGLNAEFSGEIWIIPGTSGLLGQAVRWENAPEVSPSRIRTFLRSIGNFAIRGGYHGRDMFQAAKAREFVVEIASRRRMFEDPSSKVKIQFGDDGTFKIPAGMRKPVNLLGNGERVAVNPTNLRTAIGKMRQLNGDRFEVKNGGLRLAVNQNDGVGSNKEKRLEKLAQNCFEIVDAAGLNSLFRVFPRTLNVVADFLPVLQRMSTSNLPSLSGSFRSRHPETNGNTQWFADGRGWNQASLDGAHQWVRNELASLITIINNSGFESFYQSPSIAMYPRQAQGSVEHAYISTLNASIEKMWEGIDGVGHRTGNIDAIVNTLDDLFSHLAINFATALDNAEQLAQNGMIIADNSNNFDRQVSNGFMTSNIAAASRVSTIRHDTLRYSQAEMLKDGENVVTAMYDQADYRSDVLNRQLQQQLGLITAHAREITKNIIDRCGWVILAIEEWERALTPLITSRTTEYDPVTGDSITHQRTHLFVRDYLPAGMLADTRVIKQRMTQWVDNFTTLQTEINRFISQLPNTKKPIKDEVYQTIYPRDEMMTKLSAVKAIAILLETGATEYAQLAGEIESQMSGLAIRGYASELRNSERFLRQIADGIRANFCVTLANDKRENVA